MIRFVLIKDQIEDDKCQFAFFDTITDKFIELDNQQVFNSIEDFAECFHNQNEYKDIHRFMDLMDSGFILDDIKIYKELSSAQQN